MASIRISPRSFLIHAIVFQFGDTSFWTRAEVPKITPASDDRFYVVQEHDILDNMATRFYGDPQLCWVLKRANGILLEPNQLVPGEEIRIPAISRLRRQGVIAN